MPPSPVSVAVGEAVVCLASVSRAPLPSGIYLYLSVCVPPVCGGGGGCAGGGVPLGAVPVLSWIGSRLGSPDDWLNPDGVNNHHTSSPIYLYV